MARIVAVPRCVLDEAEPSSNCREKENKPITEAHGRDLGLLRWHPLTHSLNSASQNSSVGQGLSSEPSRQQEQARRGVPFVGEKCIHGQQALRTLKQFEFQRP